MALRGFWALGIMVAMACGSAREEPEPAPAPRSEAVPPAPAADALANLEEAWRYPVRGRGAVFAVDGDALHLSPTGVVRRSADGSRRWRYEMPLGTRDSVSLETAGGLAVFRRDQDIRALALDTGRLLWERPATPVQGQEGAVYEVLGCTLRRLSEATGEVLGPAFEGRTIAARSDGESAASESCRPGALILGRAGDLDVVHVQRHGTNTVEFWRGAERQRELDATSARFGFVPFDGGGLFFLGTAAALEVVVFGPSGQERFSQRFAEEPCSDFHVRAFPTEAGPAMAVQRCQDVWLLDADGGERLHRESDAYVRFASEIGGAIDVFRAGEDLSLASWAEDGTELGEFGLDCPGCSVLPAKDGYLLRDRDNDRIRFVEADGSERWQLQSDASPMLLDADWVLLRGEEQRLARIRDGAIVGQIQGEFRGLLGEADERRILVSQEGFAVAYGFPAL